MHEFFIDRHYHFIFTSYILIVRTLLFGGFMVCPECNSCNTSKEKTQRGWSGDYVCLCCGYNNAKCHFIDEKKEPQSFMKLTLKNP